MKIARTGKNHTHRFIQRIATMTALGMALTVNAAPGQRVLCFGDSITEGGSWVASAGKMASLETINAGKSGRKAAEAKRSLAASLDRYPNVDRLIIWLGVNDLPARDKRPGDIKVTSCVSNMSEAIDLALKRFKPNDIILIAPCGVNPAAMSKVNVEKGYDITQPLLVQLEAGYKALALKKGVLFLSLLNVVSKDNYKDGLHPNKDGDAEIAQAVSTFLTTHE